MDTQFKHLIHLQELDSEINTINLFLKKIPSKIQEIDHEIEESRSIIVRAKEKLAQNQKRRRDLESRVQDAETKIKKLQTQLNDVRTNKEYTALLREIDDAKLGKEKNEEQIITEMLEADEIEFEIQDAEKQSAEIQERLSREKNKILEEKQKMESRRQALQEEKKELQPKIPPEQLELYRNIYEKKNKVALSPVTNDFCSICQIRVRPQMINELIAAEKIMLCENCGRILYWKGESAPAESKI